MNATPPRGVISVGPWRADHATGRLNGPDRVVQVEPKVMDLLFLLAARPGEVFSRETLFATLWPGVTVSDDALAQCVSKLRRALADDPRRPRYVETLSKRGYRLIPAPAGPVRSSPPYRMPAAVAAALVLAVALLPAAATPGWSAAAAASQSARLTDQADDFYFQYSRADNEAAIALYERVIAEDPAYAPARAGLANALVQRALRWPGAAGAPELVHVSLGAALREGRMRTPAAQGYLARAAVLAESAVRLAPNDPRALKALGFVHAASQELDLAAADYRRAVALDPNAWGALINLGELHEINGEPDRALVAFEQAYAAMTRVYDREAPRVRPWYAPLGVLIGDRHAAAGRLKAAALWYRKVLDYAPLNPGATLGLAAVLRREDDPRAATALCRALIERTGPAPDCAPFL